LGLNRAVAWKAAGLRELHFSLRLGAVAASFALRSTPKGRLLAREGPDHGFKPRSYCHMSRIARAALAAASE